EHSWSPTTTRSGSFLCTAASSTPIRVVTREVRYIHKLSLTLEYSMPISSPTDPGLTKDTMDAYVEEIRKLENKFAGLEIHHVDCDNNVGADLLSKLGSTRAVVPPGVFVHELHHPSVKVQSQQATDEEAPAIVREVLMIEEDWRIQFMDFIKEFKLPPHVDAKSTEAARIIRRSMGFIL